MEAPAAVTAHAVVGEGRRIDNMLFCIHAALWEDFVASDDMGLNNNGADILGEGEHVCHDASCFTWPMVGVHGGVSVFKETFGVGSVVSNASFCLRERFEGSVR